MRLRHPDGTVVHLGYGTNVLPAEDVDGLVAQVEAIDWSGRAADALRERVRDRAAHLREAAHRHETAATSLDRHAAETDRLKDAIAEIEAKARSLVADAQGRARTRDGLASSDHDAVRVQADPDDAALLQFTLPPSGHQDWLEAEIPGIR